MGAGQNRTHKGLGVVEVLRPGETVSGNGRVAPWGMSARWSPRSGVYVGPHRCPNLWCMLPP